MPAPQVIQLRSLDTVKYPHEAVITNYQVVQSSAIFDELERLERVLDEPAINWSVTPTGYK